MRESSPRMLSLRVGSEGRDEDERRDVRVVRGDVADDGAAVGVPDEDDRPVDALHDARDLTRHRPRASAAGSRARRRGSRARELLGDEAPARRLLPRAVDEHDRGPAAPSVAAGRRPGRARRGSRLPRARRRHGGASREHLPNGAPCQPRGWPSSAAHRGAAVAREPKPAPDWRAAGGDVRACRLCSFTGSKFDTRAGNAWTGRPSSAQCGSPTGFHSRARRLVSRSAYGLSSSSSTRSTGRASTARSPRTMIGRCSSSGCSAIKRDELVVAVALGVEQAELCDERLAYAQRVARADARLAQQVADRRLVDALDVVLRPARPRCRARPAARTACGTSSTCSSRRS